jgi:hypothetical protein
MKHNKSTPLDRRISGIRVVGNVEIKTNPRDLTDVNSPTRD